MIKKYEVRFDFTGDSQDVLLSTVWPYSLGVRIIEAELSITPAICNGPSDVRYQTDDAEKFAELLKLAFQFSAGGWAVIEPMPKNSVVFHLPMRGGKYSNCPDFVSKEK